MNRFEIVVLRFEFLSLRRQVEHGYRMPAPPNCPPALYEIMLETWHKDPMKRPTFETLQWKLEDFFTIEGSEYKEAAVAY